MSVDAKKSRDVVIALEGLELTYEVRRLDATRAWYRDLFKATYEKRRVLAGVDFTVAGAGITAILGRNGAGKTTLIKTMAGILTPTGGRLAVLGAEPRRRQGALLRQIGVVFGQKKSLWEELSLLENLRVTASVYSVPPAAVEDRIARLVAQLGLESLCDRPVKTFSLGESMKAEIASCLLYEPRLLFLDEPTIGLDLPAQHAIRNVIRDYVATNGAHVILTSHNLRDIAELADAIWFLEAGRLLPFELQDRDKGRAGLEDALERKLMS